MSSPCAIAARTCGARNESLDLASSVDSLRGAEPDDAATGGSTSKNETTKSALTFRPALRRCFSLAHRQRLPRRLDRLASIVMRNVQYVHIQGRHLVVVDIALALVIQSVHDKPGSSATLLNEARLCQDEAIARYGALFPTDSVSSLPPGVRPVPAPLADPPFGATAALDRSTQGMDGHGRCVLAYTGDGLAWLLGAVRCRGEPRLASAVETIARSGVVDRIGACLGLFPDRMGDPVKLKKRAAANVAIFLFDDAPTHTLGDLGDVSSGHTVGPRGVPVAAAAMRNEVPHQQPWAIIGRGDRLSAVGANDREACALLAATAACLVRRDVTARLFVDAMPVAAIGDEGFRHALDVAFGLALP